MVNVSNRICLDSYQTALNKVFQSIECIINSFVYLCVIRIRRTYGIIVNAIIIYFPICSLRYLKWSI